METRPQERSALPSGAMRLLAAGCVMMGLVLVAAPLRAQSPSGAPSQAAALPFRSEPPLRSYVAVRRFESENTRHHKEAWLVARTELRADGTFLYEVLDEGGSEFIRRKVLHEALEKEAAVHRDGRARRSGITAENYEFAEPIPADGGLRVDLVPRRKDDMLVRGVLVTSNEGELLRVEGELVKRPSFWTRSVHLVRHYGRVAGTRVPVRLDMVAQVRLAGQSTLSVTYEYQEVNGRPVEEHPASLARAAATARPMAAPR